MTVDIYPCDLWHVVGSKKHHKWSSGKSFIKFCCDYLPEEKLPIKVNGTGYIYLTAGSETYPAFCWDKDEFGRKVIIVDDILIFQRMQKGDVLMYGKINDNDFSNCVDSQLLTELYDKIKFKSELN